MSLAAAAAFPIAAAAATTTATTIITNITTTTTTTTATTTAMQEHYTNYVHKMQRDAEESAARARAEYKAELEALHAKYQEEFGVMMALDKNRAKQSMVAMKRLQTASARAQEDARVEFDRQLDAARANYDRELRLQGQELEHMRRVVAELRVVRACLQACPVWSHQSSCAIMGKRGREEGREGGRKVGREVGR